MKNELKEFGYEMSLINDEYICFNTKIGAIFDLSKDEIAVLNRKQKGKKLNDKDVIIYKKLLKKIKNPKKFKKTKKHFNIQWHITDICNLRCKHCYMVTYVDNGLKLEKLEKIAGECIRSIDILGFTPDFALTGGEPFLNKNLFKLINYIKSKNPNSEVSILTNGTLIDEKIVKKLIKTKVDMVQVSLESSNRIINDSIRGESNYEKVTNAIKLLSKNKVPINMHFVLSKKNKTDVINYIKLAKKLGAKTITISNLVPMGTGKQMEKDLLSPKELKETYSKILKFASKNKGYSKLLNTNRPIWCNLDTKNTHKIGGYCPVGFNTITILPNADILPCRRLDIKLGNLLKENFFEIWYKSKLLWNIRNQTAIKGCGKCKKLDDCGGCRAMAHAFYEDYMGPDPQCWLLNNNLGDCKKCKID